MKTEIPNRDIHGTNLENEQHQLFILMTYSCFAVVDEEDINRHFHLFSLNLDTFMLQKHKAWKHGQGETCFLLVYGAVSSVAVTVYI